MTDVTVTNLPKRGEEQTAQVFLTPGQKILGAAVLVAAVLYGILAGPMALLKVISISFSIFIVVFVGFKLLVTAMGAGYRFPRLRLPANDDPNLPSYSILIPMRDEGAYGFGRLVEWIGRIEYPTHLLQVMFIVDQDDTATLEMVRRHSLPSHMELVEVPTMIEVVTDDDAPRTKPLACDYAMLTATGQRTLIWDFEDRAEVLQLLKAVATLNYWTLRDRTVACVQGMLQFWNAKGGTANAFYYAEYVVNFRWMLPGLARLGLIPPLGGTSNHFLTPALREVARQYGNLEFRRVDTGELVSVPNIWDPYNVTEDLDLAMRLAVCGYNIKMVDAVTFEEAPKTLKKATNQKSRWLKGFIITCLVQMRNPIQKMREVGPLRYLAFNLYAGGTPLSFLINPIMWATTLLYIASRLAGWHSITLGIESLFPPYVYYPAMIMWLGGTAVLAYQMVLTPLRQQEHESFTHMQVGAQKQQFGLSWKLALGILLWWVFTTVPAYKAISELFSPEKRRFWNKTRHGDSMHEESAILGDGRVPALPGGSSHVKALGSIRNDVHDTPVRPSSLADAPTAEQRKVQD